MAISAKKSFKQAELKGIPAFQNIVKYGLPVGRPKNMQCIDSAKAKSGDPVNKFITIPVEIVDTQVSPLCMLSVSC